MSIYIFQNYKINLKFILNHLVILNEFILLIQLKHYLFYVYAILELTE
jgi:hypothetical protein